MSLQLFFERLKEERLRLGLTQDELAAQVGVSKRSYCAYESGDTSPSAKLLAALVGMGCDVAYLLTGERLPGTPALTPEESALLDNFRHSPPAARKAIRRRAICSRNMEAPAEKPNVADRERPEPEPQIGVTVPAN